VNQITPDTTWFNSNMQQVYLNSAEVASFAITSGIQYKRVDIVSLYYPYEIYLSWFMGKARSMLTKIKNPYPVMNQVYSLFDSTLKGPGYNYIVSKAINGNNDQVYWDGWLGMGDDTPSPDDRIFVTGMTLGVIMDTFTTGAYRNGTSCGYKWESNAPQSAKDLARKAANFLNSEIFGSNYRIDNCATCQDVKTTVALSYTFPSNVAQWINGTKVDPSTAPSSYLGNTALMTAVQGVLDESVYQTMLKQTRFGVTAAQLEFQGFDANPFACWNIPSGTYLVTMIGLAKYISASTCSA